MSPSSPSPTPINDADDDLPRPGKVWQEPKRTSNPLLKPRTAPATASNIEPVDPSNLPAVWQALLNLMSDNASLHAILSSARLVGIEDGNAKVHLSPQHGTFVNMFDKNGKKELVREKLSSVLNEPIGVKFEVASSDSAAETATALAAPPVTAPRTQVQPIRREIAAPAPAPSTPRLTQEQKDALRNDPWVKAALETFGGEIVKVEPSTSN